MAPAFPQRYRVNLQDVTVPMGGWELPASYLVSMEPRQRTTDVSVNHAITVVPVICSAQTTATPVSMASVTADSTGGEARFVIGRGAPDFRKIVLVMARV